LANKTLFGALLSSKCPQCREGNFFLAKTYNLFSFMEMPKNCPHCKVKIEPEPGYFWGAMYFSYALVVGLSVSMIVIFLFQLGRKLFSDGICDAFGNWRSVSTYL